jgi:hypothetical protein
MDQALSLGPVHLHPLVRALYICALAGLCVALHAAAMMVMFRWLRSRMERARSSFVRDVWLLVRVSWALILLHLIEIMVWAVFFVWRGALPDLETAFYFSSITYTTVGYGDVVLDAAWRNFSSAAAVTGILMTGLSTSFFFMFLGRLFARRLENDAQQPS